MLAGFAHLQPAENACVPVLVDSAGVDWLLELAPVGSPSPALKAPRHRMLLDGNGQWCFPCRAPASQLPLDDESLPAVLMRHLFQPGVPADLLEEVLRCLKPGGLLVSVSANPWHRASWRELGRNTLQLPAWPKLLLRHARYNLQLQIPRRRQWRGLLPGLSPVLVVVARKPPRAAPVRKLEFSKADKVRGRVAAASQCRAA